MADRENLSLQMFSYYLGKYYKVVFERYLVSIKYLDGLAASDAIN